MKGKITLPLFIANFLLLSISYPGCKVTDPGPGGIIPPGNCLISGELANPREWNVENTLPVCEDVGYNFPCACESYNGSYPNSFIINGRKAYESSGVPGCKPHWSHHDPYLRYTLPGCAYYVQVDGILSRWHDFYPVDDDVTFDICPKRATGWAYFRDYPNYYSISEVRTDGNFRNYFIDFRVQGSMHIKLQGCRYFDGYYIKNTGERIRGARLGDFDNDPQDNGIFVSVIGDWVVDAGADVEHDEWAEIHEARGIVVRRPSSEPDKYYLVANIFFTKETRMNDDFWMFIPIPPPSNPALGKLNCRKLNNSEIEAFRGDPPESVPWSCLSNEGANLAETKVYVSPAEGKYECQLHFMRCTPEHSEICSEPNDWQCGDTCDGNDFNTEEDCDTVFWAGIVEAFWTDPGDTWLCYDCQCEDLAVPGTFITAPIQGCASGGLNPSSLTDQFRACQEVCGGKIDENTGNLLSSGQICGASPDCRIGGCYPPLNPREGMAEIVGESSCDPTIKPSPDSLRVSRTGDYSLRLIPRDSGGSEGSFSYQRLGDYDAETSVSGRLYFNTIWSEGEWGHGFGIIEFSNMNMNLADFEIEDKQISGGSVFTVSRVEGFFETENPRSFMIGAGWGSYGLRGYVDGELKGIEVVNPANISGTLGNIEAGERNFSVQIHAEEPPGEEEEKELDAFLVGIVDNVKPVAQAGPDRQVECTSPTMTFVVLDGRMSYDPDPNDFISHYQWFKWNKEQNKWAGISNQPVVPLNLPLGEYPFALHVYDLKLGADKDDLNVKVVDTTPPQLEVSPIDVCLWPPNHKLAKFELGQEIQTLVQDVCDPNPSLAIVGVTSNEPDDGQGDGHTTGDIRWNTSSACVRLKVERSGIGYGRIYTIRLNAWDHTGGNETYVDVFVRVPHDHEPGCITVQTFDDDDPACIF